MRVWIENPYDNLPDEGYRPMRYWLMATAFAAAGHDVTLFTADFSHANKARRRLTAKTPRAFDLVLVEEPPYPRNVCFARIASHRAYARNWLARARAQAAANGAPDLIIASIPPLATVDAALTLRRLFGSRLVFDIMDAWPETFQRLLPRGFGALGRILFLGMERAARRACREADLITGVCDRYESLMRRRGAKDYRRFYHGVDVTGVVPTEKSGLRLVYAGNLGRGYDLGTVIRAVRRLPEATLDIAGAGDGEATWRALAEGEPRIRFHGYLPSDRLEALLDASSVGVIPLSDASFVGLPYKIGDYVRHSLRIVSSLDGECGTLLARYAAGRVYHPGDPDSLIAALDDLAEMKPDTAGLLRELDATRIYAEYVKALSDPAARENLI